MRLNKFALVFIVILALFLRLFALGSIPPGLTNDEADIGYDAFSLLNTGRDQWGTVLPITSFKGFGDYRLPLYTYLVVPAVKVFGLHAFAVRLPSAIFGVFSVILIYFLARKLFERTNLKLEVVALSAAFLMAISPWSIGLSRIGIESNVAIAFFLAGFLSFLYSLKRTKLIILSALFFALTLYTYTSYTLFTPMALIVLFLFFKKEIYKYRKMMTIGLILFAVLVFPLFLFKSTAGVRASQITFINSEDNVGLLTNLNDRRGSCGEKFPTFLCKVVENKQKVFVSTFVNNYLNHFSLNFLFLHGTNTQYSMLPPGGLFPTFGILLLLSGLACCIKLKSKNTFLLISLLLIAPIPDALTGDGHYSRAADMIPFIVLIESIGVAYILKLIGSLRRYLKVSLYILLCVAIFYSVLSFTLIYISYFPKYFSNYSQYGYEAWAKKLSEEKKLYSKVFLSRYGNDTKQYIYYLFYNSYDPSTFQKKKNVSVTNGSDGWISVDRIDNFYFRDRIPAEEDLMKMSSEKVLLVTHPTELPKDFSLKSQSTVKDKNGNGVFVFIDAKDLLMYYAKQKPATQ